MSLTTEIEKTERANLRKEMFQTGTPFGYWIITGVVEHGLRYGLYGLKAKT